MRLRSKVAGEASPGDCRSRDAPAEERATSEAGATARGVQCTGWAFVTDTNTASVLGAAIELGGELELTANGVVAGGGARGDSMRGASEGAGADKGMGPGPCPGEESGAVVARVDDARPPVPGEAMLCRWSSRASRVTRADEEECERRTGLAPAEEELVPAPPTHATGDEGAERKAVCVGGGGGRGGETCT